MKIKEMKAMQNGKESGGKSREMIEDNNNDKVV